MNYHVILDAEYSATDGAREVGDVVVVMSNSKWGLANTANRATGRRPAGIMLTAASAANPNGAIQQAGYVAQSISHIDVEAEGDYVNVDANGRCVRSTELNEDTIGRISDDTGGFMLDLARLGALGVVSGGVEDVPYEAPIALRDGVVPASDDEDEKKVLRGTAANQLTGRSCAGIVLAINDDDTVTVPTVGSRLNRTATGLSAEDARKVIVLDDSGHLLARTVARFGEIVVGTTDDDAVLHFLPHKSRASEAHVNAYDFGARGLDTTAVGDEVRAAALEAWENTGHASYPNVRPLHIPAGVTALDKPIVVNQSYRCLEGVLGRTSKLIPTYKGPRIFITPPVPDDPPIVSGGPFSGNCFIPTNGGNDYYIDVTQAGCAQLANTAVVDGATSLRWEGWVYYTTGEEQTGSDASIICGSLGTERNPVVGNYDSAMRVYRAGNQGGTYANDNIIIADITIDGTPHRLHGENVPIAVNTWTHVIFDFDGTNVRLGIAGTTVMTTNAPGTVTQKKWESFFIGAGRLGFNQKKILQTYPGKLGPMRLSDVSRVSGGTYTVPSGPFTPEFGDLFVTNWDEVDDCGMLIGASYRGIDKVWAPIMGGVNISSQLVGVRISNLTLEQGAIGEAGGILVKGCVGLEIDNVSVNGGLYGLACYDNTYFSRIRNLHITGANLYAGIIDLTTSGNEYHHCHVQNHLYNAYFGGGVSYDGSFGQWAADGASWFVWEGWVDVHVYIDAEAQDHDSRGVFMVTGAQLSHLEVLEGSSLSVGNLVDQPLGTIDGVDAVLNGLVSVFSPQSEQIEILRDPPNEIRIGYHYINNPDDVPMTLNSTARVHVIDRLRGDWKVCNYASDANRTCTPDEFTYGKIKITDGGTVLTTGRNFTVPDIGGEERTYWNATAQTITVTTGSGTTVPIAAGAVEKVAVE